jgi:FkbM family methyltransferase
MQLKAAVHGAAAALAVKALMSRGALRPMHGWSRHYGTIDPGERAARLRDRVFAHLAEPVWVRWLGVRLRLYPGDQIGRAIFLSGQYEPDTMIALRGLLPDGGVFLDVGANQGFFSLFAAQCLGSGLVVAFEPSAREFQRLTANIAGNRRLRIQARREALADYRGEATLLVAEDQYAGLNTIGAAFAYTTVNAARHETVACRTLDDVVAELALNRCDVIKIDVEGAESSVLRGAADVLARFRPALIVEQLQPALAANQSSIDELEAIVLAQDYRLLAIDEATGALRPLARLDRGFAGNFVGLPRRQGGS